VKQRQQHQDQPQQQQQHQHQHQQQQQPAMTGVNVASVISSEVSSQTVALRHDDSRAIDELLQASPQHLTEINYN